MALYDAEDAERREAGFLRRALRIETCSLFASGCCRTGWKVASRRRGDDDDDSDNAFVNGFALK